MAEKEKIKGFYTLFTVEVFFSDFGEGSFGFNISETVKKRRWWWFDKTIEAKKLILSNIHDKQVITFLNSSKNYKVLFEKCQHFEKHSFDILEMYFDDVMFDILTELKDNK